MINEHCNSHGGGDSGLRGIVRKWMKLPKFKFGARLFAFRIAQILLGKELPHPFPSYGLTM